MATKLSPGEMLALVALHGAREKLHDWEGALATMTTREPFYELFPYRVRIAGPDAIRAMWMQFSGEDGPGSFSATIPPESFHLTEFVNDEIVVQLSKWEFVTDEGERQPTDHVVIFRFDGDRILSESIFCDTTVMHYMDRALDARLRSLPGVTQI